MNMPQSFEEALDRVLNAQRELLIERHRKYGPGNINAFGERGCLIRLSDKVERLKNFYRGDGLAAATFVDESVTDSWMDAANYSVIRQMYVHGWWDLPLSD